MAHKLSLALIASLLACIAIAVPSAAAGPPSITKRVVVAAPATTAAPSAAKQRRSLIASAAVCPGQESLDAPVEVQEAAMRCMIAHARSEIGLAGLLDDEALAQSASNKAGDIISCDDFSHFACGRDFTYWMQDAGYMSSPCWRVGENLAWGAGPYGTVRSIFRAWMNSSGHRANILSDFVQTGVSLRIGTLAGQPETHVWAQHFGTHCDGGPAQG